jgi:hypothetical protein
VLLCTVYCVLCTVYCVLCARCFVHSCTHRTHSPPLYPLYPLYPHFYPHTPRFRALHRQPVHHHHGLPTRCTVYMCIGVYVYMHGTNTLYSIHICICMVILFIYITMGCLQGAQCSTKRFLVDNLLPYYYLYPTNLLTYYYPTYTLYPTNLLIPYLYPTTTLLTYY